MPQKAHGVRYYIINFVSIVGFFKLKKSIHESWTLFLFFSIQKINRATIVVLIAESRWTDIPRERQFNIENNSTCYLHEEYEIIRDCHPCTGTFVYYFCK